MKEKFKHECPECGSDNVVYNRDDDETVCNDCGNVYAELAPDDEDVFEDVAEMPHRKK